MFHKYVTMKPKAQLAQTTTQHFIQQSILRYTVLRNSVMSGHKGSTSGWFTDAYMRWELEGSTSTDCRNIERQSEQGLKLCVDGPRNIPDVGTSENDQYTKTDTLLGRDFEVAASINELYEQSSIILTSNKRPKSWGDLVGEQGIVMATLDRLLHR